MNEPTRLRDDPAFDQLTGGALHDEPLALGPYDLEGIRARVVAGEAPVRSTPRWTTLVGVSGLTAALVTVALWALLPVGSALPPLRPTPAPLELRVGETRSAERVVVPAAGSPDLPVDLVAVRPAPPAVEEPVTPAPVAAEAIAAPEPAVVPEKVGPPEPVAPPPAEVPTKTAPPEGEDRRGAGGLQAELADYNRALDAAEAGRWSEARERYQAYLDQWPVGRLRTEATLGLLGALVRSERPGKAESLAERLLIDPAFSHRRDDIRLLRAEALVELDLCDEALDLIDGLRRDARIAAIRSTCRRQRR
jgi:hypothetical protein